MEDGDVGYKTQKFLSQVSLILEGHRKSTFFFLSFLTQVIYRKEKHLSSDTAGSLIGEGGWRVKRGCPESS